MNASQSYFTVRWQFLLRTIGPLFCGSLLYAIIFFIAAASEFAGLLFSAVLVLLAGLQLALYYWVDWLLTRRTALRIIRSLTNPDTKKADSEWFSWVGILIYSLLVFYVTVFYPAPHFTISLD